MKLVRVGGVIGYDNTLWHGSVALKEGDEIPEFIRASIEPMKKDNNYLASDPHIKLSHISIGDGLLGIGQPSGSEVGDRKGTKYA
ncbi:hypothetical protein IFM89_004172 [Coptis chinensis]|uniref:Uncharacterized protein n=1 Tax=Coptis chinensis TaxID=261450 RepID=A0A835LH13_9MAGN|nr:hypothetical protein IFM89_004172 [Coptis chinensis]